MTVSAGGKSISSGATVLEGTIITISPTEGDGVVSWLTATLGSGPETAIPLCYTGTSASYQIPTGAETVALALERQTLDEAPGENIARVIFVGNPELPVDTNYNYATQIKTYWEAGASTRKSNFDMQWPSGSSTSTLISDYIESTYKTDFAKNAHGVVVSFGEAELTADSFNPVLFTAEYAAVLAGFRRARPEATVTVVSLLPHSQYTGVQEERWTAVDTAIRTAAEAAGAFLVDLNSVYEQESLAGNTTKAWRRVAEEIFLGWYPTVEPYSVIPTDKDIPVTPQQKWQDGTVNDKVWTKDGNGNQDFKKYTLIKKIQEKPSSEWPQVIFTGDSITDLFDGSYDESQGTIKMSTPWKTYIGYNDNAEIGDGTAKTYRALNLGNSGDFAQSLLYRFQNLDGKPASGAYTGAFAFKDTVKAIVLNIGTNNIGPSKPTSDDDTSEKYQERPISSVDTVRGIQSAVELLKKEFPKAKIIVMGLFPRGEFTTSAKNTTTDFIRLQVLSVDRQLQNLYGSNQDSRVQYLYLYESFVDDNGDEKSSSSAFSGFEGTYSTLFYDSLHPNNAGYKIWWDAVEPEIKKALGIQ